MATSAAGYVRGQLASTDVSTTAGNSHASAHGATPDNRRMYDFSDRVAELAPEESPFFVYLSKIAKVPTSDPVFRFLENRSKLLKLLTVSLMRYSVLILLALTQLRQYAMSHV